MSKYAVISTDSSSEYYSLIPIVAYSWHKLGYTPIVIMVNCEIELQHVITKYCPDGVMFRGLPSFEGVKDGTIAQFARLFIASEIGSEDDIIVTGDGDMIVMKDIFVNSGMFENYGMDLTGYSEYPICYNSASVLTWNSIINVEYCPNLFDRIEADLPPNAYSEDWAKYWSVDQVFLTSVLNRVGNRFPLIRYDRGFSGPVAAGRWDRYNWNIVPAEIIDVHCIRGLHRWPEITAMAEYLFPGEVGWMGRLKAEIDQLQHTQP